MGDERSPRFLLSAESALETPKSSRFFRRGAWVRVILAVAPAWRAKGNSYPFFFPWPGSVFVPPGSLPSST